MFCIVGKYAHEHLASCVVEVVEKFNAVISSGMSSNNVFGSLFGNSQESISCKQESISWLNISRLAILYLLFSSLFLVSLGKLVLSITIHCEISIDSVFNRNILGFKFFRT